MQTRSGIEGLGAGSAYKPVRSSNKRSTPSRLMVSPDRRASAYGLFTGIYGTASMAGSIVIGALFNISLTAIVVFCMAAEFAGIPLILMVRRQTRT